MFARVFSMIYNPWQQTNRHDILDDNFEMLGEADKEIRSPKVDQQMEQWKNQHQVRFSRCLAVVGSMESPLESFGFNKRIGVCKCGVLVMRTEMKAHLKAAKHD